jgi:hypothetical protein
MGGDIVILEGNAQKSAPLTGYGMRKSLAIVKTVSSGFIPWNPLFCNFPPLGPRTPGRYIML